MTGSTPSSSASPSSSRPPSASRRSRRRTVAALAVLAAAAVTAAFALTLDDADNREEKAGEPAAVTASAAPAPADEGLLALARRDASDPLAIGRGRSGGADRVLRLPVPVLRPVRPRDQARTAALLRGQGNPAHRVAQLPHLRRGVRTGGAGRLGGRAAEQVLGVPRRRLRQAARTQHRRLRRREPRRHGPRGGNRRHRALPGRHGLRRGPRRRARGPGGGLHPRRDQHPGVPRQRQADPGRPAHGHLRGSRRDRCDGGEDGEHDGGAGR